jgi:hypothetical protein
MEVAIDSHEDRTWLTSAGTAAGNMFGLSYGRDVPSGWTDPLGKAFVNDFCAAHNNRPPTVYEAMGYDAAMTAITVVMRLIQTNSAVTRDAVVNGLYYANYAAVSEGAYGGMINFSRGAVNPPTADADIGDNLGPWPFDV